MTKRILIVVALLAAFAVGSTALAATVPASLCERAADPAKCCKQIVQAMCGASEGCVRIHLEQCILESL